MAAIMSARITLYLIVAALIAAHFLRAGDLIPAALCLMTPLLFLLRGRWNWSLPLLQGLAYAAALNWFWTAWELVVIRRSYGRPWLLAAAILVAVAALSALAGVLLRGKK
jgi:hypothetical protein